MSVSVQAQNFFSARGEETQTGVQTSERTGKLGKSIFAGNLGLGEDPIVHKRRMAQQQAMKLVRNAWANDKAVESEVADRKAHYAQLETERKEETDELEDIHMDETVLKELYGVADDSKEQQDLELLKKRQDYQNGVGKALSAEEAQRVAEIDKSPLTEYQERALELNNRSGAVRKNINETSRAMQDDIFDVKSILLEKLKSDPMVDAKKAAESIWAAANDEIIGMLVQEATDHIDEEIEKAEEQAKEKAEEKEEKEEIREELELKRAVQQAMIEQTKEAADKAKTKAQQQEAPEVEFDEMLSLTKNNLTSSDVKQGLDDIKNSMKLLEADLKGIQVDEEI